MVGDNKIDQALLERSPQLFAISALADRRGTLELCPSVGNLFRQESKVVRAGLDGDCGQFRLGLTKKGQCRGRREVNDVDARVVLAGKPQKEADRFVFRFTRPGSEPCRILRWRVLGRSGSSSFDWAGKFGMSEEGRAKLYEFRQGYAKVRFAHMREFVNAARYQKAFESEDACFPQRPELRRISRNHTAPESNIHPQFPFGSSQFFAKAPGCRRGGNAVEGHLDQGGDAACGGRAGCCRKSFPVRSAWLIDVDVRIHQPRHDHGITGIKDGDARGNLSKFGNRHNDAVVDVDCRGARLLCLGR